MKNSLNYNTLYFEKIYIGIMTFQGKKQCITLFIKINFIFKIKV